MGSPGQQTGHCGNGYFVRYLPGKPHVLDSHIIPNYPETVAQLFPTPLGKVQSTDSLNFSTVIETERGINEIPPRLVSSRCVGISVKFGYWRMSSLAMCPLYRYALRPQVTHMITTHTPSNRIHPRRECLSGGHIRKGAVSLGSIYCVIKG